jgi:signal transduction histidine kinase
VHRVPRWRRFVLPALSFVVSFAFSYGDDPLQMPLLPALLCSAAAAVAVWFSERFPMGVLLVTVGAACILPMTSSTFAALNLVVVVVVYRAASSDRTRLWVVSVASLLALTINDLWQRNLLGQSTFGPSTLYPVLLTGLAVGFGMQTRRVRQQNAELATLHDVDRRRAVSDERRRIARDLHDVAAHHLTALAVRNRLAIRIGTPEALEEAAEFTAGTAAETLTSLRHVVRVLGGDTAPMLPSPTLADIDAVIGRMESAGLTVFHSSDPDLPAAGVDAEVALVRIAQEALANILRHRGPGQAWLQFRARDGGIALTVEDDGHSGGATSLTAVGVAEGGQGYGLISMQERAESCGGHLEVGTSPRGGWLVSAVVPAADVS